MSDNLSVRTGETESLSYDSLKKDLSRIIEELKKKYDINRIDELHEEAISLLSLYKKHKEEYAPEQRGGIKSLFLEYMKSLSYKLGMKKFMEKVTSIDDYFEAFWL